MPADVPVRAPGAQAPSAIALAALAAAVFAAALALRLSGLGAAAVSLDEVYTQFAASRDWPGLVLDRASRGHMPTYFALAKLTVPDMSDLVARRRDPRRGDRPAGGPAGGAVGRGALRLRSGLRHLGAERSPLRPADGFRR